MNIHRSKNSCSLFSFLYSIVVFVLFKRGISGKQKMRPAILEEEDLAKTGMGAVLNMARRKGFLDQEEEGRKDMGLKDLICKDYKIDDKSR